MRLPPQRQTRCVDCNRLGRKTSRPALKPGPRCDEHHHERKRELSKRAHGKRLEKAFQITSAIYDFLYLWQGGRCYGCRKGRGLKRRLAVDHDHTCTAGHAPEVGCPKCIRALLCAYCNEVEGRLDADALRRLIEVKENPPAQRALREMEAQQ